MNYDTFLRACRREPVAHTPVWLMRQAGRYLPDYRALRAKTTFRDVCVEPDLATEVTLLPFKHFALDAAILFSDLLVPLEPLGLQIAYETDHGPAVLNPVRSLADVRALRTPAPEHDLHFMATAVRQIRAALAGRAPLLGFVGAPFTLASYAVEGRGSRDFVRLKSLMYQEPATWAELMGRLAEAAGGAAALQVRAGVQAVQVFDTWAGALCPADFRAFALPHIRTVIRAIKAAGDVPVILYVREGGGLIEALAESGADVLSLDWRIPLAVARQRTADALVLQGNLDPCALFAPPAELERRVREIVEAAAGLNGHVFNLGHGVLPATDPAQVARVVDTVHRLTARD